MRNTYSQGGKMEKKYNKFLTRNMISQHGKNEAFFGWIEPQDLKEIVKNKEVATPIPLISMAAPQFKGLAGLIGLCNSDETITVKMSVEIQDWGISLKFAKVEGKNPYPQRVGEFEIRPAQSNIQEKMIKFLDYCHKSNEIFLEIKDSALNTKDRFVRVEFSKEGKKKNEKKFYFTKHRVKSYSGSKLNNQSSL